MGHLSWLEAIVIGVLQGVSELFPVSSLGHSVLLPAVIGGSWAQDLDISADRSPYLAFIVGLHVATAIALVIYFWRDWVRVVRGLYTSIVRREVSDPDQRLAWLLVWARSRSDWPGCCSSTSSARSWPSPHPPRSS